MSEQALREHVLSLLKGGGAHLNFEQAISNLPENLRGAKVKSVSHTPWRLLEHLRICRAICHDILEFSARVLATFPCEILRFSEIPVEFSL